MTGNKRGSSGKKETTEISVLFAFFNEVGIISQLATTVFEENLPDGLTASQFSVLNWFARVDSEATPGRLAKAFQVTPGAMTNTLKRLATKGLMKVEPDPDSGRKKRVTITAKGRTVREKAITSASPMLKEFAKAFPAGKIERQVKALQKIRQHLDEQRY